MKLALLLVYVSGRHKWKFFLNAYVQEDRMRELSTGKIPLSLVPRE